MFELLPELDTLLVEHIGHAFEKEHAEDIFLVFRGVHLATQDVRSLHQKAFELGKSDLVLIHRAVLTAVSEANKARARMPGSNRITNLSILKPVCLNYSTVIDVRALRAVIRTGAMRFCWIISSTDDMHRRMGMAKSASH